MRVKLSILMMLSLSSVSFAQSPYHHRDRGLVLGGLVGALTGGAIGRDNGNTAAGAAIGTAVGALTGAAIGDSVDTDIAWQNAANQRRYAGQISRAVTVQDVISMTHARLSEDVIITHVRTNGIVRRPQPADLITMSNSGVSDAVIRTMQTARLATAPLPPPPSYRNRVIVQEHHYVTPCHPAPTCYRTPTWYHHHRPHRVHSYHRGPSVHWVFSFGH